MQRTLNVVLIDEAPTGQGFDRHLYAAGCNVVGVFGYGRQTAEHLRRPDYDVIVVAVRQPLIRSLRAVEMATLVSDGRPVVTYIDNLAAAPFQLMRQVMRAGAADAFSEPVRPTELMELLWRAILVADRHRLALRGGVDEVIAPGDITVVFGAKGGTGKTTLSLNLAYGQSILSDERVALVDLDPQLGGVPALLDPTNFRQVSPATLTSFLDERLADKLENHIVYSFGPLTIIRLGDESEGTVVESGAVTNLLEELSLAFDHVYVDSPAPWTPQVQEALGSATLILFTVIPDLSTLVNARTILTSARETPLFNDKAKVIVNQATMQGALRREAIEEGLGLPVMWQIPTDPAIVQAAQLGVPLVQSLPNSQAAQRIFDLLYAISGAKRKPRLGTLARIVGRFRAGDREGESNAVGASAR
jgi:pilus assembly protein CpaE